MPLDPASVVRSAFHLFGLDVQRRAARWQHVAGFDSLLRTIRGHTLVTPDRCLILYQLARSVAYTGAALAELGVYRGGTAKLLAKTFPNNRLHLFDTFRGLPAACIAIDKHRAGEFAETSLSEVRRYLKDCDNVAFHAGIFPGTAFSLSNITFAFVHLDADLYASIKAGLNFFYPRMVPGGIIVIDDYEWSMCPGVERAVHEFLADKPEEPLVLARCQCCIIRQSSMANMSHRPLVDATRPPRSNSPAEPGNITHECTGIPSGKADRSASALANGGRFAAPD